MTLNQYIYDIWGLLRNHNITDEDYLTDRMIEFWIIGQRATWIKKRDRAFIHTDHSLMQTVVTPVISIDRSFVPDLVSAEYKILRSEERLPKAINFESWDGILHAGPIDMAGVRFNHVEYEEAMRSGYGRFNKTQIFSFTHDRYLYLKSRAVHSYWHLITQAAVTGIWEDPREVGDFTHIDGEACWNEDMDYPLSLELWAYMKDEIRKGNINELLSVPVDRSNDDNTAKGDTP